MFLSEWIQSDSPMPVQNKSGKLLHKQECIMADESAQIRLVLWEDDINKLVINKSYKLDKMKIRMYNDVKYLSVSSCTTIESIDDIGHMLLTLQVILNSFQIVATDCSTALLLQ